MSANKQFTKENLDTCLKELAKEFRKRNGNKMPAEIILIGGASVLINYGFREMTYDMDAIIRWSQQINKGLLAKIMPFLGFALFCRGYLKNKQKTCFKTIFMVRYSWR